MDSSFYLVQLIQQVRDDFEARRISLSLLEELYHFYVPSIDAAQFVHAAQLYFPRLNCGLASLYIQHVLHEGRIVQGQYEENPHTVLLLHDSHLIDITADQFGGPPVYVGLVRKPWVLHTFDTIPS